MTWRVWVKDWVAVFTSDADGPAGETECAEHFVRKYLGTVLPTEHRIKGTLLWPATLELYLPTVVEETKDYDKARALHGALVLKRQATWMTEFGQPKDKELESYGKRKLPT